MSFNSTLQEANPKNNIRINDHFKFAHPMKQSMAGSILHVSQFKNYNNLPHVNFSYQSPQTTLPMGNNMESKNKDLEKDTYEKWSKSKNGNNGGAFVQEIIKKKITK